MTDRRPSSSTGGPAAPASPSRSGRPAGGPAGKPAGRPARAAGHSPRTLGRARTLARVLDRSFRVPGTSFRFGLDPLLGLLPVGGDVLAALGSGYILYVGWRAGAPGSLLGRMLFNVAVDTVVGSVPVIGDLFDAGWKANARNMRLLEEWLGEEGSGGRGSTALLIGIVVALVLLLVGVVALFWWLARTIGGGA